MLSRVAESLYWAARSIERAENTSTLLHVNFHGLLDADLPDRGRAWQELLLLIGRDDLFREHFDEYTAEAVSEFLVRHPSNPDAVVACVARARENLRGVREQVSTEMWEHVNRLHLLVSRSAAKTGHAGLHEFLIRVRQGSHSFQGVTKATLPRGEAYEFLELGAHLERADATARLLAVKAPSLLLAPPDAAGGLVSALLKSSAASEAFRRQEAGEVRPLRVVEYLLLERQFPRATLFCLELCLSAIRSISGISERPERAIGRMFAELCFVDLSAAGIDELGVLLRRVLAGIDEAAVEVAAAYFTTRVVVPGPYAHAQQQQ